MQFVNLSGYDLLDLEDEIIPAVRDSEGNIVKARIGTESDIKEDVIYSRVGTVIIINLPEPKGDGCIYILPVRVHAVVGKVRFDTRHANNEHVRFIGDSERRLIELEKRVVKLENLLKATLQAASSDKASDYYHTDMDEWG